jgi:spore maturation protein SpmB
MAVTLQGSGTKSATVATEHTLLDIAVAGTFTLHVDTVNMVALDALELRIYQMILTGGTTRVAYLATYFGAQAVDDLIKISVPISNELTDATALRFTLKQTYGTSRNFPWKCLRYS